VTMSQQKENLLTISEASAWASNFLNRNVTESNISYLIQYGKISKRILNNEVMVDIDELKNYYEQNILLKEKEFKEKLGENINWHLSFDWVKESERTKHVHRLHPYKGKFIPQLVEYFLDRHTDEFKKEVFFKEGDIVIDPFCGSGTTLIQANELGIHSIGIEISEFNSIITQVKFAEVNLEDLENHVNEIMKLLTSIGNTEQTSNFEKELDEELKSFNTLYFPSPEFKKLFDEEKITKEYLKEKENLAKEIFQKLLHKYGIGKFFSKDELKNGSFVDQWYMPTIKNEVNHILDYIKQITNENVQKTLKVILSRTMRSVRATTHMDLDRLKEPQLTPYYCYKHFKICVPPFSLVSYFKRYSIDTLKRLSDYQKIKTPAFQCVITGDSRTIDLFQEVGKKHVGLYELLKEKKAKGIFTSPPYLGQLDYHEQHAYSYELFGIERRDDLEIGAAFKGINSKAKEEYINDISAVLSNMKKYLADDAHIFIVANDKYNLYHKIATKAGLKIIEEFNRPVLNRTARDKNPYSETIFHMIVDK